MLLNCIAASPGWGWGENRGIKLCMASSVVIEQHPDWCLMSAEDFLWILINGMLDTENSKWPFSLLSLKWSMSSLKGDLSKLDLKFKCKRQCIPYFEGRQKLIPLMAKMLCERKQLLLQVQNSASIISLLEAWWEDSFNVEQASFKWPGAPGTGTWYPVSAEVSWWVCAALFLQKTDTDFFFSIQIEIIGKFEQHKYTRRNDFRKLFSQQFTTESVSCREATLSPHRNV